MKFILPHLTDHWSREKIADWVATIEPKEEDASVHIQAVGLIPTEEVDSGIREAHQVEEVEAS